MNGLQKMQVCMALTLALAIGCAERDKQPADGKQMLVCTTQEPGLGAYVSYRSPRTDYLGYQEKNGQWYIKGYGYYQPRQGEMCARRS